MIRRLFAKPGFIRPAGLIGLLLFGAVASGAVAAQQTSTAEVERRVVGTWELVEWHLDGQILKPPAVNGRIAFHDGQVVTLLYRSNDGIAYDFFGYGTYSFSRTAWSYGYDRIVEITGKESDSKVTSSAREQIRFNFRKDGPRLILDYQNGERRFVFGEDDFTYFEKGQMLRKWRRLKDGR